MKALTVGLLSFALTLVAFIDTAKAVPQETTEYISPAEPHSVLRGTLVPCYGNKEKGVARNVYLRHLKGEECPKRTATPVRPEKPDDESVSPGIPFQQKTHL